MGSFLLHKFKKIINDQECICLPLTDDINEWVFGEFTKISLYVNNETELLDLYNILQFNKIDCVLITDAGHTEFGGVPTNTCIGIGPISSEIIDKFTGNLKLL